MLKPPEKAPDWKKIIKSNFKNIFNLSKSPEIQALIEKTDQKYYYWDKIQPQPLPKEFNKEEVWAFLRLRRDLSSTPSPIYDIHDKPFTFWLTDEMQKNMHLIDQSTGGNLSLFDPGNDRNASSRYMVSSLMEEAITSSQIEGAVATIKDAKKMLIEKRKPKNKSEQMIFNNYATMQSIKDICKKDLDLELLKELHRQITKNTLDSFEDEGRLRTDEDNVSVVSSYGEVLFVPPKAKEVPDRLRKMINFANDTKNKPFIHPVVKAIMLHFWLAYIHPFTDGNGRMARTLFYWYMLKHGYWLFEYTSISKTILKRTTRYANAYLYSEHDSNDLTYFIHFNIDVIMEAVEELKTHIQNEKEKNLKIRDEIINYPDLNIRQTHIIQYLISNPLEILTIKYHQKMNKLAYQTARTDLLELAEKNWLKATKKGKTLYFSAVGNLREKIGKSTNL